MSNSIAAPATILITGGTSGIGLQLVKKLSARAHKVIVIARRAGELAVVSPASPGPVFPYDCDLSNETALATALDAIVTQHPGISVVINNAALQYSVAMTAPEFDPAMMRQEVAINLIAPAMIVHRTLSILQAQNRRCAIVNMSSGLAFYPKTQTALYCATKAAIHSFSQSMRYQLADTNIDVVEVILPLVDTPMTAGRGTGKISAERAANAILRGMEQGKPEIYVGKARLLRVLNRLAPSIVRRALKGS